MATTFPTYPATTYEQAVNLAIFSSNQIHDVVNEDAASTVTTENGEIPSLRKALVDNFYFKTPIAWASGTEVTVFNQLYEYDSGWYYAPAATDTSAVTMGTTPSGDDNWRLYAIKDSNVVAIARDFSVQESEVFTSSLGGSLDGMKVIYDNTAGLAFALPSVITSGSEFVSISAGTLTHSNGSVDLAALALSRQEYIKMVPDFTSGVTVTVANQIVNYSGNYYRWAGTFPKTAVAGTTPATAGGISDTAWVEISNDIANYINVEMFGATGGSDDTTALQNAIDYVIANDIAVLYGLKSYTISDTLTVKGAGSQGFELKLGGLVAGSNFPTNTSFWDATAMLEVGDSVSNFTNIRIDINVLNGGGVADGIIPVGYGFSLSEINFGYASNCVAVIRTGKHEWPNASTHITGGFWTNNWIGGFIANGTSGTTPIVEGWKWDVKFIAANYWGGIWLQESGHYAQLRGDWDFNGASLAFLLLSDGTGLSSIAGQTQLKLTNGTVEYEFLFYYVYQGATYIVVASPTAANLSYYNSDTAAFAWTTSDTISCTTVDGVALKFSGGELAADNASKTNYFDVLHDFQTSAFAKLQVTPGYMSQIKGGNLFTTNIQMQNSFNGIGFRMQGFGVSNSGTTLAFYDFAHAETPWANITSDFVNFQHRLYMQTYKYEGIPVLVTVPAGPADTDEYTSAFTLTDVTTDKYADEGTMYHITMCSNYAGCYGDFKVFIKGTAATFFDVRQDAAWAFQAEDSSDGTGVTIGLLQRAQSTINMLFNIRRV